VRPAVFLDRDGTMIRDAGYLSHPEELEWFPWTLDAIRLLNRAGLAVVVVTNQGGIGLGLSPEDFVQQTPQRMAATAEASGARVDAWLYCPHHPQATTEALRVVCDCRKPRPGLPRRAARDLDLDLTRSFVVGDKFGDLGLAASIGGRGVLVRSGRGEGELARHGGAVPDGVHIAADLMAATAWILEEIRS
jgi:D-glycero-D-manno-heptose 1,7-bisphosphate phosphatase